MKDSVFSVKGQWKKNLDFPLRPGCWPVLGCAGGPGEDEWAQDEILCIATRDRKSTSSGLTTRLRPPHPGRNGHGVLRNIQLSQELEEATARARSPQLNLKQQADALFNDCRLRKKSADKHLRYTRIAERFADVTFWLGALCLIIFASVNILDGTLSKGPDVLYLFL